MKFLFFLLQSAFDVTTSNALPLVILTLSFYVSILAESSLAKHGDNTDQSEVDNFATSATTRSTKLSKKMKPAAQSFAANQALWQQRLPNAGLRALLSLYCVVLF